MVWDQVSLYLKPFKTKPKKWLQMAREGVKTKPFCRETFEVNFNGFPLTAQKDNQTGSVLVKVFLSQPLNRTLEENVCSYVTH